MRTCTVSLVGFVLLLFGVQEGCSQSGLGGVLLAILTGFLLGKVTLSTALLFLMAGQTDSTIIPSYNEKHFTTLHTYYSKLVTPPELRSFHRRGIRSAVATSSDHERSLEGGKNASSQTARRMDGRFLQNLIASDPLNCLPSLLCDSNASPSEKNDIINDYKFLMEEVLRQADKEKDDDGLENSGYHNLYTKLQQNYDDEDAEEEDRDSDERESDEELDKIFDLMALKEKSEIEDQMYSELVEEDPANIGYVMADIKKSSKKKKQRVRRPEPRTPIVLDEELLKYIKDPDLKMMFNRFKDRVSRNMDYFTEKLDSNPEIRARNPRLDKLAFFSRKQRELRKATTQEEKLRIATDVGLKYKSARQCRRLFSTCPFPASTLSRLVNNLRRVLTGVPKDSNKQTASLANKGSGSNSIVSASTEPGTNVQVVVNLGAEYSGSRNQAAIAKPASAAVPTNYRPAVAAQVGSHPLPQISVPHAFPNIPPIQTRFTTPSPPPANYQSIINALQFPPALKFPPTTAMNFQSNIPSKTFSTQDRVHTLKTTTTRRTTTTTRAPKITTTTKPPVVDKPQPSKFNIDSETTTYKPFLGSFFDFFAFTEKPPVSSTLPASTTTKLFTTQSESVTKPSSMESGGFGYPPPKPSLHTSSTTTEKGYLLPVGFDASTRTIPSSSTVSEFMTTTINSAGEEEGFTWTPLEHLLTNPTEESGAAFTMDPPNSPFVVDRPSIETFKTLATTASPERAAAAAFLMQLMSQSLHTKIASTTIRPQIVISDTTTKRPIIAMSANTYLQHLEQTLKSQHNQNKHKTKTPSKTPTIIHDDKKESEELLDFIKNINIHQGKRRQEVVREKPKDKVTQPPEEDDPDMREIDEVIKLLDEELNDDDDDNDDITEIKTKKPITQNENRITNSITKQRTTETPTTTKPSIITTTTITPTTTTSAPGIINDINEVIRLLDQNERKDRKPTNIDTRIDKGKRSNRKNKNKSKRRKPKPLSEESSEEQDDDNMPPNSLYRFPKARLNRPLIAVPYAEDSEEDSSVEPPSPVKAFASGVYSYLFTGINNKVSRPPSGSPLLRFLPRTYLDYEPKSSHSSPQNTFRYGTDAPEFHHQDYRPVPHLKYRMIPTTRTNKYVYPYDRYK